MNDETALAGALVTALVLASVAVFAPHVLPGTALVFLAEYAAVGAGSALSYYALTR